MSNWSSPFPLSPGLQKQLEACGLQRHKGDPAKANGALLLIYRHPATLLEHWRNSDAKPLRISMILKGYQQLLSHREHGTLVSDWRLEGLDRDRLVTWLDGTTTPGSISELPWISPLARLVLVELLRAQPALISAYQDLELHAELFGTQADSDLRGTRWSGHSFRVGRGPVGAGVGLGVGSSGIPSQHAQSPPPPHPFES